jgi:hypothetical protein
MLYSYKIISALIILCTSFKLSLASEDWKSIDDPWEQFGSISIRDVTGYTLPRCASAPLNHKPPDTDEKKESSQLCHMQRPCILLAPKPHKSTNAKAYGKRRSKRPASPITIPRPADSSPVCIQTPKSSAEIIPMQFEVHRASEEDRKERYDEDFLKLILEALLKSAFDKEDAAKNKLSKRD